MRISKLDGLRGIFCLMVVLVHYKQEFLPGWLGDIYLIREAGLFVDFFFVLSGFVISLNYSKIESINDFCDYLKRRFIRLYPLLFFTATLYFLYFIVTDYTKELIPSLAQVFQNTDLTDRGENMIKYLDTILFLNSTPILGSTMSMNYPSWSISAEMIVYFIFGLVMLYTCKKWVSVVFVFILLLGVGFSVFKHQFFFTGDYGFIRAYVSFTVGHFVWVLSKRKYALNNKLELLIVPLLLAIFSILHGLFKQEKEMIGLLLVPFFFGLSILVLIKSNGYLSRVLESRPFEFLGKLSYSVYLNHALILVLIPKSIFRVLRLPANSTIQVIVLLTTLMVIISYSYFTYSLIEKRGGAMLKRWIPNKI